jgi:hypothetical protein
LIHGNPVVHRKLTEGVSEPKFVQGLLLRAWKQTAVAGCRRRPINQVKDIAKALELNRNFMEQST